MSEEKIVLDVGQVTIFGRSESPINDRIDELLEALAKDRGVESIPCDFVDLDTVFHDDAETLQQQLDNAGEGNESAHLLSELDGHKSAYTDFLRKIQHCQLAIIDLSFKDISFYVLAIRQFLSDAATIALAENGSRPTFANARFIVDQSLGKRWRYLDTSDPKWLSAAVEQASSINNPKKTSWKNDIRSVGLFKVSALEPSFKDTTYGAAHRHNVSWQVLSPTEPTTKPVGPIIEIWKGDITKATGYNVWVNSENTHMEMARFWDKSVSARIRTLGAVNIGLSGDDRKDALGLALAEKMGTQTKVKIGSVFITPTNPESTLYDDENGNGVKYVAHVAAVQPRDDHQGFESGGKIGDCVENVLIDLAKFRKREITRSENWRSKIARWTGVSNTPRRQPEDFDSILFPLLGSGDGGAHVSMVAHQMVSALCELIRDDSTISNDANQVICGKIKKIGIIAYQPSHLTFLEREFRNGKFHPIEQNKSATGGGE